MQCLPGRIKNWSEPHINSVVIKDLNESPDAQDDVAIYFWLDSTNVGLMQMLACHLLYKYLCVLN